MSRRPGSANLVEQHGAARRGERRHAQLGVFDRGDSGEGGHGGEKQYPENPAVSPTNFTRGIDEGEEKDQLEFQVDQLGREILVP